MGSELDAGTRMDHFRVEELLGAGGMGEVYAAWDTKLERRVALKLVRPEALGDEAAVERFLHEARTTARFSHPHIVQVHFVGQHDGRPYVALEYLEGETLRERMGAGPLTAEEAIRVGLPIAEALAEAHAHGVLHRDLKPENVMLPADGRLRLVDFGLAKSLAADVAPERLAVATTQMVGKRSPGFRTVGLMGTPAYMAPEQWVGEPATGAVDVWALGVVLAELVGGSHPYAATTSAGNVVALAARVCSGEALPLPDGLDEESPALAALIRACVSKQAESRPSSAEVAERLRAVLHEPSSTVREEPPRRGQPEHADLATADTTALPSPARPPRRWRWIAFVAAGVTLGSAVWFALRPQAPAAEPNGSIAPPDASARVSGDWTDVWQPLPHSSSPEAFNAYLRARAAFRAGRRSESRRLFEQALQADPELAAAHLRLASDPTHLSEAQRLRSRLSSCDQLLLRGREALQVEVPAAVTPYAAVMERCAERPDVLFEAITARLVLEGSMSLSEASDELGRVLALDPGFSRARSVKADVDAYLGRFDAGLGSLDEGISLDPGGMALLYERAHLYTHFGRCTALEADARTMVRLEPDNGDGYRFLAQALAAQDRPRSAVEAALEQARARGGNPSGDSVRQVLVFDATLHGVRLGALHGDFEAALEALDEWYEPRRNSPARGIHGAYALLRAALLEESGRSQEAARAAERFLERWDAWQGEERADDWAPLADVRPALWGLLRRVGHLPSAAHEESVNRWAGSWAERMKMNDRRYVWLYGYARAAHDEASARSSLAALPDYAPIPPFRPYSLAEADVGRVYLLTGAHDEAIRWLTEGVRTCRALLLPIEHTRAYLWLGRAHEAAGDNVQACRAYAAVLRRWGDASPRSVSAEAARERHEALACHD